MAADVEMSTKLTLAGDTEYKAALKSINNELKIAKSEMNAATSAYDKNNNSIEANATRREHLGKILEEQKKKMELIKNEIEKLKNAEGDNDDDIAKLTITYNNLDGACKKIQRSMDELADTTEEEAEQTEEAEEKTSKFGDTLKKASAAAGKATFKALAASVSALGTAAAATIKELYNFTKGVGEYADDIATLSTQTGIATDTLQKMKYAENLLDVSTDTMTGAMAKLTKTMGSAKDGSATAAAKFEKLGVSIYDSNGQLKSSETLFYESVDALGKIGNETERDAVAMDLFGKSAQDLNPLIEAGSEKLKQLGEEASATGYVLSDEMMAAANSYQDAQDRMNNATTALKNTLGAALAPAMSEITQRATHMMNKITTALQDGIQPGELEELGEQLSKEAGGMIGSILKKVREAMPLFTKVISALAKVLVEHLPDILETLLPAAAELLQTILDTLSDEAGDLATLAADIITTLAEFIATNLPDLVQTGTDILTQIIDSITDSLPDLIPMAVNMITSLATNLIDALPKLVEKLPEIVDAIVEGIKNVDWITLGTDLIEGLRDGLSKAVEALTETICKIFVALWDGIKSIFGIGGDETENEGDSVGKKIIDGLWNGLKWAVENGWENLKAIFTSLWNGIKKGLGLGGDDAVDESQESGEKLGGSVIDAILNGFKVAIENIWDAIKEIFSKIWEAIKSALGLGKADGGDSEESVSMAESAAGEVLNGLITGFGNAVTLVIDTVKKIFGKIWDAIKSIFGFGKSKEEKQTESDAEKAGKSIMDGMSEGVTGNEKKVKKSATDAGKNTITSFNESLGTESGKSSKAKTSGQYLVEGLESGIDTNAYKAEDAAEDAGKGTVTELNSALGTTDGKSTKGKTAGENLIDGILSGMDGKAQSVYEKIEKIAKEVLKKAESALGIKNESSTKGEEIGKYFAKGIAKGIGDNESTITKAAKKAAEEAYKAAKEKLGIKSPSRVMAEVGDYYDQGFAQGISKNAQRVIDAASDLAAKSAMPGGGRTAAVAGAMAASAQRGGNTVNLNTTYSGPFTPNDASVFGQTLARSISGLAAVMG